MERNPLPPLNQACRLTSDAPSAIAVLEVTGPDALAWLEKYWFSHSPLPLSQLLALNRIRYGVLYASESHKAGESVVVCRTAEARFEIHCHGGRAASSIILARLESDGFQIVSPLLGLCHGLDQVQAHAQQDLLVAPSTATAAVLLDQYRGSLSSEIRQVIAHVQEGRIADAVESLKQLLKFDEFGLHLIQPWRVVLAGPPNAGKSSLLNTILGYQRAIVHESAGTTRDILSERTSIEGWPVEIIDSAGVRDTEDPIEKIGVESSLDIINRADLVLLLVAPEQGWTETHEKIYRFGQKRMIVIQTKYDKSSRPVEIPVSSIPIVSTSVFERKTIEELMGRIRGKLLPHIPESGTAIPFRPDQIAVFHESVDLIQQGKPLDSVRKLQRLLDAPPTETTSRM
jgi:tRNA modification GTPase